MTTHTELAAQVERVELYGVKDGKQTLLGTVPMPPRMMAREIAREMFGPFEDNDGSDAELCFAALEQMIEHMGSLAALSTERLAGGGEPVAWHVCSVNSDGSLSLEYAAAWQEAAHEHINDAITECGIDEAAGWVVRPVYYTTPPPQAERVPLSDEQTKDAARWKQVREHWKNARFTFRKTPKNTVKTINLLIDFDHITTCGANELEREFDGARAHGIGTPKEST